MIATELAVILILAAYALGIASAMFSHRRKDAEDRAWTEFQNTLTRAILTNTTDMLEDVKKLLENKYAGPSPSDSEMAFLRQCRVMYMNAKEEEKKHV